MGLLENIETFRSTYRNVLVVATTNTFFADYQFVELDTTKLPFSLLGMEEKVLNANTKYIIINPKAKPYATPASPFGTAAATNGTEIIVGNETMVQDVLTKVYYKNISYFEAYSKVTIKEMDTRISPAVQVYTFDLPLTIDEICDYFTANFDEVYPYSVATADKILRTEKPELTELFPDAQGIVFNPATSELELYGYGERVQAAITAAITSANSRLNAIITGAEQNFGQLATLLEVQEIQNQNTVATSVVLPNAASHNIKVVAYKSIYITTIVEHTTFSFDTTMEDFEMIIELTFTQANLIVSFPLFYIASFGYPIHEFFSPQVILNQPNLFYVKKIKEKYFIKYDSPLNNP